MFACTQVRGHTKAGHGPWSVAVEARTLESSKLPLCADITFMILTAGLGKH